MDVSDRSVRIDPIGKQPEAMWTLFCVLPEKVTALEGFSAVTLRASSVWY